MAGGMSGVAIADGYEYEPVTDYAPAPPVYSWTGTYIGFNAGWIRSESSATVSGGTGIFSNAPGKFSNDRDGFLAGLTLGYNANFGSSFVGGIESDIAYTDVDASQTNTVTVAGMMSYCASMFTVQTFPPPRPADLNGRIFGLAFPASSSADIPRRTNSRLFDMPTLRPLLKSCSVT